MANPYEGLCPCCGEVVCLRCAAFEVRLSPDGFCGCSECDRVLKRRQRAMREHIMRDHDDGIGNTTDVKPAAARGEGE